MFPHLCISPCPLCAVRLGMCLLIFQILPPATSRWRECCVIVVVIVVVVVVVVVVADVVVVALAVAAVVVCMSRWGN